MKRVYYITLYRRTSGASCCADRDVLRYAAHKAFRVLRGHQRALVVPRSGCAAWRNPRKGSLNRIHACVARRDRVCCPHPPVARRYIRILYARRRPVVDFARTWPLRRRESCICTRQTVRETARPGYGSPRLFTTPRQRYAKNRVPVVVRGVLARPGGGALAKHFWLRYKKKKIFKNSNNPVKKL